jgi:hypothetical protein
MGGCSSGVESNRFVIFVDGKLQLSQLFRVGLGELVG